LTPVPSPTGTRRPAASETPSPQPTATPEPDLSFHFGDDVSVFEQTLIITAIEVTRELLTDDARVAPPVTVFAYGSLSEMQDEYRHKARAQPWRAQGIPDRLSSVLAEAEYRGILINTAHPGWQTMTDAQLMRAVAHEYVHVVQLENTGPAIADSTLMSPTGAVPSAGPIWLLEGTAEAVSWMVADRLDLADYKGTIVDLGLSARDNPVELSKMESFVGFRGGGDDGLAMSVVASDYLLTNRSLSQLFAFWADMSKGYRWQDAFVSRFGQTIDAFYAGFDAYYHATFGG
jgi:hypothetical protein